MVQAGPGTRKQTCGPRFSRRTACKSAVEERRVVHSIERDGPAKAYSQGVSAAAHGQGQCIEVHAHAHRFLHIDTHSYSRSAQAAAPSVTVLLTKSMMERLKNFVASARRLPLSIATLLLKVPASIVALTRSCCARSSAYLQYINHCRRGCMPHITS